MLEYNQIRERKYINLDDTVYEVISSHIFRKQQRKPVNQTKLKNLVTGGVTERSFGHTDKVQEADISRKKFLYLFKKPGRQNSPDEFWFCIPNDRSKRFMLDGSILGSEKQFMKENSEVDAMIWTNPQGEEITIGVKLPIKVELKVTDAPPAVKGNTINNSNKQITLETGAVINAPMFIEPGEIIRVNTETGEYVERVNN